MEQYQFQAAKPIFYPWTTAEHEARRREAVNHYGFYIPFVWDKNASQAIFALTARNFYRLYINGNLVMHGPARTAHGYCRVDEVDVTPYLCVGENHIGVEVMVYGEIYVGYSNDCTLESGLFTGELTVDCQVALATGVSPWQVAHLPFRAPHSQKISHCREAAEIYFMDDIYPVWDLGLASYTHAVGVTDTPTYLPHKALKPTLREDHISQLVEFGSCYIDPAKPLTSLFYEKNNPYYTSLPEFPLEDCRRTQEQAYSGARLQRTADSLLFEGDKDKFLLFDGGESRVGFIKVSFQCDKDGIVDIVHSELLNKDGSIPYYHNPVTRLHVKAGDCTFITMEPCLARYIKLYFRGVGSVQLFGLSMLDYAYPDEMRSGFQCSDDGINRLYQAAKKTLLLNTLDIFMDCPERERGGWLCDSLWTARAAHMMLSDSRVEREFIENFLLTPADGMFHGFFPESYPGCKPDFAAMTGITTWSFWLMCQLCEYTQRTGDTYLRDTYKDRVEAFVTGSGQFIGASGLLERLPWLFVDWSLSNQAAYHQPISTAANALYAYMLIRLGELYEHEDWKNRGLGMRQILREAIGGKSLSGLSTLRTFSDSFDMDESGKLRATGNVSESGMATALWAELFLPHEVPLLVETVCETMGPDPLFAADPNIGKSQLFIGLCVRLDLLAKWGETDQMYRDLLAIYLPQLKDGPGTLWEVQDFNASSKCHGFTSHAGVHLMRDVLGMGIPEAQDGGYRVAITPHICGLRWARGTMETPHGLISVSWRYDGRSFDLRVSLPHGFTGDISLPREVRCLDPDRIRVEICVGEG